MHLAEDAEHLLGAEADLAVAARVPPLISPAQDLHLGGRADGGQHCFGIGLHVIDIHRARRAMHVPRAGATHQKTGNHDLFLARLPAGESGANLEKRHVGKAARLIAGGSLQQAGQQVGAHVAHVRGDRVLQPRRIGATAE